MIKGVDDLVFKRIGPYLTVMPETQVNATTAPPEVLASRGPQLIEDDKALKEILAARALAAFQRGHGRGKFAR